MWAWLRRPHATPSTPSWHRPPPSASSPNNLKLAWEFKPQIVQIDDSVRGKRNLAIYELVALKTTNGKPALSGDVITRATSEYDPSRAATMCR